jgi:prepilin-type N-terminal cleavage/methylation domain-containing protein
MMGIFNLPAAHKSLREVTAPSRANTSRDRQRGFSLVEVSIVTALMVILAIVGIPALQDYVIENKVPKVAADLQRFVARMKVAGIGGGEAPYAGVNRLALVNGLRGGSAVTVRGEGSSAVVVHGLGGQGVADNGEINLTAAAIPGQSTGSAFSLTLDHVNHAACPMLASTLQRMASQVTVEGRTGEVVVKNDFNSPPVPYQPVLADAECARGDSNRFVFVFR